MATSMFKKNFPGTQQLQDAADRADYIIGLDLHKKTTAICIVDPHKPDQPVFERKRLNNAELFTTISRFAGTKVVACEAAYGWHRLAHAMDDLPDTTLVPLDARRTSSWVKGSGIKNDRLDAQVLCAVILQGGIRRLAVYRTGDRSHECTKLVRHRDHLARQAATVKRQIRALESEYGPNPYTGELPPQSALASDIESDLRSSLLSLQNRIAAVESLMTREGKGDAVVARLQSIPGIGPVTAFALRHKIEDIERFESAANLTSYVGLSVRQRQSGTHNVTGKIAKTGDAFLRRLLVQGAQVVRTRKPDLLPLYFPALGQDNRMAERIHRNKTVVALARKNLTFAWHVWKNAEDFNLQRYRERRASTGSPAHTNACGCPTQNSVPDCVPSREAELDLLLVR